MQWIYDGEINCHCCFVQSEKYDMIYTVFSKLTGSI